MKIRSIVLSFVAILSLAFPLASKAAGENNIVQSISVINETKNRDAALQPAEKEDYLTYTVTVRNTSLVSVTSYSFAVNITEVLPFADLVDKGGATLEGTYLFYPAMNVQGGSTVTKSFKVRVKYFLPANNISSMNVVFGNNVNVSIARPSITMNEITNASFNDSQVKGAFVAPKTGADINALWFGLALALGYGIFKYRKQILSILYR
jgi:uncharacterized repeat protein (TIGR01451 family)